MYNSSHGKKCTETLRGSKILLCKNTEASAQPPLAFSVSLSVPLYPGSQIKQVLCSLWENGLRGEFSTNRHISSHSISCNPVELDCHQDNDDHDALRCLFTHRA